MGISWKQIFIFIGFLGFLSLGCATSVVAQNFKETHRESLSDKDFFKKFRVSGVDESAIALLSKEDETEKIYCGSGKKICDAKTEVCLKCRTGGIYAGYGVAGGGKWSKEVGRCVSKASLNKSNLRENWPDEKDCPVVVPKAASGSQNDPAVITIEEKGFLDTSQTTDSNLRTHKLGKGETFSDGTHTYKLFIKNNKFQIAYNDSGKEGFSGCKVFPVKVHDMTGCFYCNIAAIVYSTAQKAVREAFEKFGWSFRALLAVVFGIWVVLMSATYVFSMTKQDAPKFLSSLLITSFKIMIVYFLLLYPEELFRYFIRPVLEGGMNLGNAIKAIGNLELDSETLSKFQTDRIKIEGDYYGNGLFEQIQSYLGGIQAQLAYLQALGSTLFCVGSHQINFINFLRGAGRTELMEGIRIMFLGAFMTVFAFLLTIAFGFYFIDAIIHLVLLGAMLPLMIATWPLPFKLTKYASSGFSMFLNVFFTFFLIGFVISVNLRLINETIAVAQQMNAKTDVSEGFKNIIDALYAQNFKELNRATDIGIRGFLLLLFGCLFGFKFVNQAVKIASQLSGDKGSLELAPRVATMGASLIKGAAAKMTKPIANAAVQEYHASGGVGAWAGNVISNIGGLPSRLGNAAEKAGQKLEQKGLGGAGKILKGAGVGLNKVGQVTDNTIGRTGRFIRGASKKAHQVYRKKI